MVTPHWLKLDKVNWEIKSKPGNDKTGPKRGARGVDREDNSEFFRTFDRKADRFQYGEKAVGMFATVDKPQVVVNAQVEGDDV